MEAHMNFFYILAWPLGYVMELIYNIIPNYGWDLILFRSEERRVWEEW